jgi:hypothetical protein
MQITSSSGEHLSGKGNEMNPSTETLFLIWHWAFGFWHLIIINEHAQCPVPNAKKLLIFTILIMIFWG